MNRPIVSNSTQSSKSRSHQRTTPAHLPSHGVRTCRSTICKMSCSWAIFVILLTTPRIQRADRATPSMPALDVFLSFDDNCLSSITHFLGRDAHLSVGTLTCACRALQRYLDAREHLWSDLLTAVTGSAPHSSRQQQQSHRQSKRLRRNGKAKFVHQLSARSDRSVMLVVGCTADLSRGQLTCARLKKRLGELEVLCGAQCMALSMAVACCARAYITASLELPSYITPHRYCCAVRRLAVLCSAARRCGVLAGAVP